MIDYNLKEWKEVKNKWRILLGLNPDVKISDLVSIHKIDIVEKEHSDLIKELVKKKFFSFGTGQVLKYIFDVLLGARQMNYIECYLITEYGIQKRKTEEDFIRRLKLIADYMEQMLEYKKTGDFPGRKFDNNLFSLLTQQFFKISILLDLKRHQFQLPYTLMALGMFSMKKHIERVPYIFYIYGAVKVIPELLVER